MENDYPLLYFFLVPVSLLNEGQSFETYIEDLENNYDDPDFESSLPPIMILFAATSFSFSHPKSLLHCHKEPIFSLDHPPKDALSTFCGQDSVSCISFLPIRTGMQFSLSTNSWFAEKRSTFLSLYMQTSTALRL